ncbi:hypothetical protein [Anaerotignum sp.]|uniref:hypothetical protein n=1 Tax=Anaerotignum sp. TaxID=2039241 RepID=UPI0033337476
MGTYSDPFSKAAAFWNKFYPLLQSTRGSEEYWDYVAEMGEYFIGETEQKLFVLLVDELEKRYHIKQA